MFKVIALVAAFAATTGVAGAQATGTYKATAKEGAKTTGAKRHKMVKKEESAAALQAEARIPEATARATALKQVPGGSSVKKYELEREHGTLIYSYDITVPGRTGIEEIAVSALDGSVIAREHETAKMEKKEAALEAKEKKAKK
jgi:uncharacterized membrane protein YkoI